MHDLVSCALNVRLIYTGWVCQGREGGGTGEGWGEGDRERK